MEKWESSHQKKNTIKNAKKHKKYITNFLTGGEEEWGMLEKPQSRNGAIKRHPNVTAAAGFNSRRNFYGDGIFSGEKRQAINKHSARVCVLIRSSELGARPGGRKWVLDGRMVGQ